MKTKHHNGITVIKLFQGALKSLPGDNRMIAIDDQNLAVKTFQSLFGTGYRMPGAQLLLLNTIFMRRNFLSDQIPVNRRHNHNFVSLHTLDRVQNMGNHRLAANRHHRLGQVGFHP